MTVAELTLRGIVKMPLIPQRWRWVMANLREWATITFAGIAAAVVVWTQILGGPSLLTGQSKDVQALQGQVALLQKQQDTMGTQISNVQAQLATLLQLPGLIQRLNDRLDASPRTDLLNSQLTEIQRHLSALDGRMDGMDTRARADEDRIIRDDARIDAIEHLSKEPLGNRR